MINKLLLSLLFVSVAISSLLIGNGITQNFQTLYAKNIQFEANQVGILLQTGARQGSGQSVVTIPDMTGNITTTTSTGITSTTITCWKANGQLGKCTTSIAGVLCNTCT